MKNFYSFLSALVAKSTFFIFPEKRNALKICTSTLIACLIGIAQYAQTYSYGTGLVAGNTAPYAAGNVQVTVASNSATVIANTTIAGGTYNFINFTVNPSVTLTVTGTSPLIIRCTGTATINGIITASGGNGANGAGVNGGAAGAAGGGAGTAGGGGGNGTGSAVPGGNGINFGGSSGRGLGGGSANLDGSGGGGGNYSGTGMQAGSGTSPGAAGSAYNDAALAINVTGSTLSSTSYLCGGSGGGGGGSSWGSAAIFRAGGGGGGGGGGSIQVTANVITIAAAGQILSRGGNGGTGVDKAVSDAGGGAGGSGGTINLQYFTLNNSGTISVTGGTGANGGGGAARKGGNGGDGRYLPQQDAIACSGPSLEATNIEFSNILDTSLTITFDRGNGTNVLVVGRLAATSNVLPAYNTSYAADPDFGSGGTTGTGNYVLYNGTGSPDVTINVTGLAIGSSYIFRVYEYIASPNCYTTTPLSGTISTLNSVTSGSALTCAYTYTGTTGFSTITGEAGKTIVDSGFIDDEVYPNQDITALSNGSGFVFNFNGVNYSSFGISSNGFIWFGTGTRAPSTTNFTPLGSTAGETGTGTIDGVIAACGADLIDHFFVSAAPTPVQISTVVTGTAPNRVVTIEWAGFVAYAVDLDGYFCNSLLAEMDESRLDFQIKLYENGGTNSNRIELTYRDQFPFCVTTAYSFQAGLRGATTADFLSRAKTVAPLMDATTTTNGAANTSLILFNTSSYINGNTTFRYDRTLSTPVISPSPMASNPCPSTTVSLSSSVNPNYQWFRNGSVVAGPGSSSQNFTATQSGSYTITSNNGGCYVTSAATVVTISPCNVNITASAGANGSISPAGTVSVVYGANQGFTITPDACFQVADVLVDGVSQGAITTFTFTNVTTTHTIAASFVAATEICNGIDDDCDTFVDEGFDVDGDGYTTCDGDCDDNDSAVNPLATEVCNGIDDDCDSSIDEGFDVDGDTYTTCEGDCDDGNAAVYPGATEVCNGIDDDCDSSIDEGFDADGDGYTTCAGDCNDADAEIHPLAEEGCNGIDDNCDSVIDDGYDADGDGYTSCNGDCDNYNSALNPGATELCNGIDDDCDGLIDEGFDLDGDGYTTCNGDCDDTNPSVSPAQEWFADMDGDGYGSYIYVTQCTNPGIAGVILTGGDCDDTNPAKNPGATEICQNGIDDNCNNLIDELCNMPINNNYTAAIVCSSSGNAYPSCGALNGTVVDATISAESNPANVVTGEDVWYSFSALSTGCRIAVVPNGFNAVIELRNSSNVQMDVEDTGIVGETEIMNFNGLTVGQNYRIAVRNYDSALGAGTFTICAQHLMPSYCNDGSGNYQLCSNFKPKWTGANTYTFNFDPTGATPGSNTSGSSASSIPLSTAALSLQYGGTYDATIDAVYNLVDGDNVSEIITVLGTSVCSINLLPHASVEVKLQQRCPTTLLKGSVLQGKPFVCGATNFTVEFTPVSDCIGTSNLGLAFEVTTAGSSSLGLSFTTPQSLQNNTHYRVRYRPNFAYGAGVYGTPRYIFIGGSSYTTDELNAQNLNDEKIELVIEASLYPNPNDGEMLNINMTNVESNKVYMRVLDNTGRVVYSSQFIVDGSLNTIVVFEHPLASGLYAVELIDGNRVITEKMIVEK